MRRSPILSSCVLLASALFLLAGPLAAQSIPSPYRYIEERQELGVFAAPFWGDPGQLDLGPGPGVMAGVRWGIDVSGPLGIEAVGTWVTATRDVINPRRQEGDRKVGEADVGLLFLDARLRLALTGRRTWHGFQPFVLAGAGVGFDVLGAQAGDGAVLEPERYDFGTQFTGTTGAGFRFFLGRRWVIRADAMLFLYQVDTPRGFLDNPTLDPGAIPESEWVSPTSVSLGLAFRF
jgi:hypothetical protein